MKRSRKKLVLGALLLLPVFLLGCSGCSLFEKAVEEGVERAVEEAGDVDIDVDEDDGEVSWTITDEEDDSSISFGTQAEWPDDIPSDVPEFKYGEASGSSEIKDSEGNYAWTVVFDSADSDAAEKYKADLEAEGWEMESSYDSGDIEMFTAVKNDLSVTVAMNTDGSGGTVSVSYVYD